MISSASNKFSLPVELQYGDRRYVAAVGPFEHSLERQFSMQLHRKALEECNDSKKLREVANSLLDGWCAMNTALQSMMLENIQLRQRMSAQERDLEAASEMMEEATRMIDSLTYEQKSKKAKKHLWPW